MVRPWERPISDEERRQYHHEVDEFLSANETSRAAFEQGIRFHQERPVFNQPSEAGQGLDVLPDLKERLHLAMRAQKAIRSQHTEEYNVKDYTLSLIQLSSFLFSDLDFLRQTSQVEGYMTYRRLTATEAFLAIFLQRLVKLQPTTTPSSKRPRPASSLTTSRRQKIARTPASAKGRGPDDSKEAYQPNRMGDEVERNENESQLALERDQAACVITGSIHPDACHIWPFDVNNNVDNLMNTRAVLSKSLGLLSPILFERLTKLLVPDSDELGSSDKAWNMIALSPELHRYWPKAYFGLKWIGADSLPSDDNDIATFKVEWRWLPRDVVGALGRKLGKLKRTNNHASIPEVDLESEETVSLVRDALREAWTPPSSVYPELARAKYASSGRPVETGHIISLRVRLGDLEKTETLIKAQWIALQMVALSGASEIVDELIREPPRPMDPPAEIVISLKPREADDEEQPLPGPPTTGDKK